ncbi:MAG: HAD-IIB family hydrolase [Acidobacteria bacterium]|nr:HAD-IIB family hydrolase [Acidobacteriota bacterium]
MRKPSTTVIYTDLDGTLLDHQTYSCAESLPALRAAMVRRIPVVFCSSKTRAEVEVIQQYTLVRDPFIVENGGAVYVPGGYFPFSIDGSVHRDGFEVIELGTPYLKLVETLRRLREDLPCRLIGFSDLTDEGVAADSGLTLPEARRAKQREYDEAFKIAGAGSRLVELVLQKIEEAGLRYSIGGRYYHLHDNNDKGRAVHILTGLFKKAHGSVVTVGIGDSLNDLPMLEAVDLPVLVQKPNGQHDRAIVERMPHVRLASGIGPQGWKATVMEILAEMGCE